MTKGGRNLTILGAGAVLVALVVTTISLTIYRVTGDIYLDRSRPGVLPDEEEVSDGGGDPEGEYNFSQTGPITKEILEEYLEKLETELQAIDAYTDPFSEKALSDEKLFGL